MIGQSFEDSDYISLTIIRVRVAAAESMPLLLECARVRGPEYLTQMWHFMCDALIKAIGTEPDSDVLSEIMHSFAKVNIFLLIICMKSYVHLLILLNTLGNFCVTVFFLTKNGQFFFILMFWCHLFLKSSYPCIPVLSSFYHHLPIV